MPWRFDELAIEPGRIEEMHCAYEKARAALGLALVSDKINEFLVAKIVELGTTEDCGADRLCEKVLAYFHATTSLLDESGI